MEQLQLTFASESLVREKIPRTHSGKFFLKKPFLSEFNNYLDTLKKFSDWMTNKANTEKDDVSAAANDYLKTLGYVSIAYAWIKVLEVSFKDYNENKNFYDEKVQMNLSKCGAFLDKGACIDKFP